MSACDGNEAIHCLIRCTLIISILFCLSSIPKAPGAAAPGAFHIPALYFAARSASTMSKRSQGRSTSVRPK